MLRRAELLRKAAPSCETGISVVLEDKGIGEDGVITGYGAVFDNIDRGGDIIVPGAFGASLKAGGPGKVKMLMFHDPMRPIGVWDEIVEDKLGLKMKGRLLLDVDDGLKAHRLMRAGAVDGLSIGYRATVHNWDSGRKARIIEKVDLWEVSIVTFPMNERARATVKGEIVLPSDRELEAMLRDGARLSIRDAKAAVSVIRNALRDGGETADGPRDEVRPEAITSALDDLIAHIRS